MLSGSTVQLLTGIGFSFFVGCLVHVMRLKRLDRSTEGSKVSTNSHGSREVIDDGNGQFRLDLHQGIVLKLGVMCMNALLVLACLNIFFHDLFFRKYFLYFHGFPFSGIIQVVGFGAILLGEVLLFLSYRRLGSHWAYPLDGKKAKQGFVTTGPYRIIRHPVYLAFIIIATGMTFLLMDAIMAILCIAGSIGLVLQALAEEKGLIKMHGKPYIEYMKRTGRFLPRASKKAGDGD